MRNGMTPLFTFDEMERWFEHFQSKAEDKMLVFLQAGGEKFIEVARRSGSYKDQTGNLRSSIGYIIAKNGKVVAENFTESEKGTDKTTGKYKGRRLAEEEINAAYKKGKDEGRIEGMLAYQKRLIENLQRDNASLNQKLQEIKK